MKRRTTCFAILLAFLPGACTAGASVPPLSNIDLEATYDVRAREQTAPSASETALPSDTDSPDASDQPGVPGLDPLDLIQQLEDYGFVCSPPNPVKTNVAWRCDFVSADFTLLVTIWGKTAAMVDLIEAAAFYYGDLSDYSDLTAAVFGLIARSPYEGSTPDEAQMWAEQSIASVHESGDEAADVFGGVRYYVYALPSVQVMEIGRFRQ
jgi:hypothetical protein